MCSMSLKLDWLISRSSCSGAFRRSTWKRDVVKWPRWWVKCSNRRHRSPRCRLFRYPWSSHIKRMAQKTQISKWASMTQIRMNKKKTVQLTLKFTKKRVSWMMTPKRWATSSPTTPLIVASNCNCTNLSRPCLRQALRLLPMTIASSWRTSQPAHAPILRSRIFQIYLWSMPTSLLQTSQLPVTQIIIIILSWVAVRKALQLPSMVISMTLSCSKSNKLCQQWCIISR